MAQLTTCHIVPEQADTLSSVTTGSLRITTNYNRMCLSPAGPDVVVPAPNRVIGASTPSHRQRTQSTAWLMELSAASDCTLFWLVEIFATASSNRTPPSSLPRHSKTPNGIFLLASAGSTSVPRWGPWSCWVGRSTGHKHKCRHSSRLAWRYRRRDFCLESTAGLLYVHRRSHLRGVQKFEKKKAVSFIFIFMNYSV